MTDQNYYPLCNSGETLGQYSSKDPYSLFAHHTIYQLKPLYLLLDFDIGRTYRHWDGEFLLFMSDGKIDYSVLTSLN